MQLFTTVSFVVGLGLLGCAQPSSNAPFENTYDVCGPIVMNAAIANEAQLAGIDHAMALWHARGVSQLARGEAPDVSIVFEKALPALYGMYDDRASLIYINQGLLDPEMIAVVVAHELGHAFGLMHISPDVAISVMNPGNLDTTPTADDRRALEALWGVCDSP